MQEDNGVSGADIHITHLRIQHPQAFPRMVIQRTNGCRGRYHNHFLELCISGGDGSCPQCQATAGLVGRLEPFC